MDRQELSQKAFEETIKLLKSLGAFIKIVGEVEKTTGKSIEELYNEIISPENMTRLAEYLPPDIIGKMLTTVFRIYNLLSKTKDLSRLDPDEKLKIGEQIIDLANQLEQVVKEAIKILEQKPLGENSGPSSPK